jgi:thioesterase domain-containing protein
VFELSLPLSGGGTLYMPSEQVRTDPALLLGWLAEHRIECGYLPPFFMRWMNEADADTLARLRLTHLLVGVEPLAEAGLQRFLQRVPGLRILNGYGPTEATIYCTSYADIGERDRICPIGRPLSNTQVYLLDARQQPVPCGVAGELYIGGEGLARGYLGRPDLTAERFVPNPFGPGRLYRSGDLARYHADGNLKYVGRTDNQVKVRGFRIELGEVEAALAALPQVREAAVVALQGASGDKYLAAYASLRADAGGTTVAQLRAALQDRLPGFMVPSRFVLLDTLPLNPSGKLDRKALPAPEDHGDAYAAPEGPAEERMAALWSELLDVPRVGRHDNFFQLGGNSLLAIRLLHVVRQNFGRELPVGAIFRAPSLSTLSALLAKPAEHADAAVPLNAGAEGLPLFCLHPVGGQVFVYERLARELASYAPVYGIVSVQAGGAAATLEQLGCQHADTIGRIFPDGPVRMLGWSSGGSIALATAAVLEARGRTVSFIGMVDAYALCRPEATEAQLAVDALLSVLGSLRGVPLGPVELAALDRELDALDAPLASLWTQEAHPILGRLLTRMAVPVEPQFAAAQLRATFHDVGLLAAAPLPVVSGPLHVLRASTSPAAVLGAGRAHSTQVVEGDHYSIMAAPAVTHLASAVRAALDGTAPSSSMEHVCNDTR